MRGYTETRDIVSEDPIEKWTYEQCKEYLQKYPKGLSAGIVKKRLKEFDSDDELNDEDEFACEEVDNNEGQTRGENESKEDRLTFGDITGGIFSMVLKIVGVLSWLFGLVMFILMIRGSVGWSVINIFCCIGAIGLGYFIEDRV